MKYICYQCMEDTGYLFGDSRCYKCTREEPEESSDFSVHDLENFNGDENLRKLGEIFATMGTAHERCKT